jgi:hypothetical protein
MFKRLMIVYWTMAFLCGAYAAYTWGWVYVAGEREQQQEKVCESLMNTLEPLDPDNLTEFAEELKEFQTECDTSRSGLFPPSTHIRYIDEYWEAHASRATATLVVIGLLLGAVFLHIANWMVVGNKKQES